MRRRKTVDAELITSFGPCEGWPEERVREAMPKRMKIGDFLRAAHIPADDRLWVALRREFISHTNQAFFACDCAEEGLRCALDDDPRPWAATEIVRRYIQGKATAAELAVAKFFAMDAACDEYLSAAMYAARYAAVHVVEAAALDAVLSATDAVDEEWVCEHLAQMIEEGA